jgi:hypothetical protein
MAKIEGGPSDQAIKAASPERVAAFRTGLSAESRAAAYLLAKGYRILARRFRTPHGEIDIVAKRRNLIAFVCQPGRGRVLGNAPAAGAHHRCGAGLAGGASRTCRI